MCKGMPGGRCAQAADAQHGGVWKSVCVQVHRQRMGSVTALTCGCAGKQDSTGPRQAALLAWLLLVAPDLTGGSAQNTGLACAKDQGISLVP